MAVTTKTCRDCGKLLRSSHALRCARCKARNDREGAARRVREMRARRAAPATPPLPTTPFGIEGYWQSSDGTVLRPEEALKGLRDPTRRPAVGTAEWEELKRAVLDFAGLLSARRDPLGPDFVALYNHLVEEGYGVGS